MSYGPQPVDARYPGPRRGYRGMNEKERSLFFRYNSYIWPPKNASTGWPPQPAQESAAYTESRDQMESWIRGQLHEHKERFDEWAQLVQSRLLPSFTHYGFKLFDFKALRPALWHELAKNYEEHVLDPDMFLRLPYEEMGESRLHNPMQPRFYHQDDLNARLLDSMRPELEGWSGVPLQNGRAYGVRVYRNRSTLVLHVDKPETHVISCIVHIGHDLDEPWPLQIEDHDGVWHELELEAGQGLMYESAKQYHARMRPMAGRHYGSVFLHWFPSQYMWNWTMWDIHVAVPPDFAVDGSRPHIFHLSQPPFLRSYAEYWRIRGLPQPRLRLGVSEPVQYFATVAEETQENLNSELREAAKLGDVNKAATLLEFGAKPNAADKNGWTAVHETARQGSVQMLQLLAEHGGRFDEITKTGDTAYWIALTYRGEGHPISRYLRAQDMPSTRLGDEL